MHRAVAHEIATLEAHLARAARRGLRGAGLGTITSLPPDQVNESTALMAIAWALLDAESRNDRAGAASIVPVFVASYNAWNAGARQLYTAAPASLDARAPWGTAHDTALTLVIATYAWMQQRTDAQIHALLGGFPRGAVPNAFRGTWFITQVSGQFEAPLFMHAVSAFRTSGAAGLSDFSDSVARGVDPAVAATPVRTAPATPSVPSPRTSSPPAVLPEMTITAHTSRPSSPTWYWYALGGAAAIGLGVFAWQKIGRAT